MAFSADDDHVAAGVGSKDGGHKIYVWNRTLARLERILEGEGGWGVRVVGQRRGPYVDDDGHVAAGVGGQIRGAPGLHSKWGIGAAGEGVGG